MTYKTFKRSCTVDTGLTAEQAQARCDAFNAKRTTRQIHRGTKLEFVRED